MKKLMITGALAAAIIAGSGTGAYIGYAKENTSNTVVDYMQPNTNIKSMSNSINPRAYEDMQEYMENGNVNFGQMKPYMKQMHPDLSDKQLEEMYKSMHGTGGAAQSQNFQGMMGNL